MKLTVLRHPYLAAWNPDAPRPRDAAPIATLPRPGLPSAAEHDLLVPNPRPDLTLGLQTLRMIQVG